ncbi:hypothetical protein BHQ23_11130 [Mycobacterium gordonae]|uniref:Uncharacterized protein n=1 Tax=Mycobacterium gordonae TaxID=1778 RepID=A0A1X1X4S2_MYCGO|nr:hypothetical protein BHQ23_11130 [Mycobacterium gordonae]ORV93884.1 hypothetical protein AWC08_17765 [Mycobacterium gordonae]
MSRAAALPIGHAVPHTERDLAVQGVRSALPHHGAVPADDGSLTLGGTPHKSSSESASLAAAVLHIHTDRGQTAKREIRLLSSFTGAHPHVPVVGVPSLPFDVSDLEALRALADQITSA